MILNVKTTRSLVFLIPIEILSNFGLYLNEKKNQPHPLELVVIIMGFLVFVACLHAENHKEVFFNTK